MDKDKSCFTLLPI